MKITEIKIVEVGVNIEIKLTLNNVFSFYSKYGFESYEQARKTLEYYGIQEIKKGSKNNDRKNN